MNLADIFLARLFLVVFSPLLGTRFEGTLFEASSIRGGGCITRLQWEKGEPERKGGMKLVSLNVLY